jgi:lipid-binding SYLF domain-containing protein
MDSEALLFITTAKMAFLGGVKFGTGLLVNRLPGTTTGWSAPCAVGSFGLAFGAIAGVMVTDVIIPLRSADALAHFQKAFSFTLGGEAGFAFGPIGRNGAAEVDASSGGVSTAVSLSNSKGIYGGVTLDGKRIIGTCLDSGEGKRTGVQGKMTSPKSVSFFFSLLPPRLPPAAANQTRSKRATSFIPFFILFFCRERD